MRMKRLKIVFTFILGFTLGAVLAILLFFNRNFNSRDYNNNYLTFNYAENKFDSNQLFWKHETNERNKVFKKKSDRFKEPNKVAKPNYSSNILCVIISNDLSNSFAASKSWAQHCNQHYFIGMDNGKNSNADNFKYLNVTVFKPKHSWHFLCDSIRYLYNFYKKTMQWVIFVQDDVFVIPENLRYYVLYKDYNKPYYLGDQSFMWSTYYNTAEAGFVLSKGAMKMLVKKFNSTQQCENSGKHWKTQDFYLGKHLASMDVHPEDTRDSRGRGRFHTFTPEQLLAPADAVSSPGLLTKYFRRRLHPNVQVQGKNCCSDRTITFQGTTQSRIFYYYYLLYYVRTFVVPGENPNNLSRIYVPSPEVWKKVVRTEFEEMLDEDSVDADKYYELWSNKISPNQLNAILRKISSTSSSVLRLGQWVVACVAPGVAVSLALLARLSSVRAERSRMPSE